MKIALCSLALGTSFLLSAHADLTIVYSSTVQPAAQAAKGEDTAPASNVTIRIKGDKARIDASPKLSTIVDGTTGDVVNLMNEQKTVVRLSRDKVKAVTEMLNKFAGNNNKEKEGAEKPRWPCYPRTTAIDQIGVLGRREHKNARFSRFPRAANPYAAGHDQRRA